MNTTYATPSPARAKPTASRTAVGIGSSDWLASAERMGDKEESILCAELFLLRRIAETSSDVVKAEHWEELREACGGMEPLRARHADAVATYEQWLTDGEG